MSKQDKYCGGGGGNYDNINIKIIALCSMTIARMLLDIRH